MLLSVIQFPGYLYGSIEGTLYLENTLGNTNHIRNYIKGQYPQHNYLTWHCSKVAITKLFSKCSETTQ